MKWYYDQLQKQLSNSDGLVFNLRLGTLTQSNKKSTDMDELEYGDGIIIYPGTGYQLMIQVLTLLFPFEQDGESLIYIGGEYDDEIIC